MKLQRSHYSPFTWNERLHNHKLRHKHVLYTRTVTTQDFLQANAKHHVALMSNYSW